ncbi:MAG: hypothetical protein ABI852_14140, partial [Gemmatimonadaceae bacterium]
GQHPGELSGHRRRFPGVARESAPGRYSVCDLPDDTNIIVQVYFTSGINDAVLRSRPEFTAPKISLRLGEWRMSYRPIAVNYTARK